MQKQPAVAVLIASAVLAAACGGSAGSHATATPSPTPAPNATQSQPAKSTGPAAAATNVYHDVAFGYSLTHPTSFHELPGSPRTDLLNTLEEVYFSDEDVSSPLGLGPSGAWVTVRVARLNEGSLVDYASRHPSMPQGTVIQDVRQLNVSGEPAIQQKEIASGPDVHAESAFLTATYVAKDGLVYAITMLAPSQTALTLHRQDYDVFVGSFELR